MLQPRVTDISHHNTIVDFSATAAAGIWGVIHKATQGTNYRDPTYAQRRGPVHEAGMMWGAYHFGDNSDPIAQVDAFLKYAAPGPDTMLCLDYEDHPSGKSRSMRPDQMVAFLREILRRTGRRAVLYSGNVIKENISRLSAADRDFVVSHPLWLCQYGNQPKLPQYFQSSFLWQYTDGVVGPQPRTIPGIKGQVDLNMFNGTRDQLQDAWYAPPEAQLVSGLVDDQPAAKPARGSDDGDDADVLPVAPARGSDDGGAELPPFLRAPSSIVTTANGGVLRNVRPQTAKFDIRVQVAQQQLLHLGYFELGDADGKWGGKTAAAIAGFYNDRGIRAVPEVNDQLADALSDAIQDEWSRPIAVERAKAKPEDLKTQNDAIKTSMWQRLCAKIAAGAGAIGLTGSTMSSTFSTVRDKLQPVLDTFNAIPGPVWFLLMCVVAGGVWYATNRVNKSVTTDFNTGKLN